MCDNNGSVIKMESTDNHTLGHVKNKTKNLLEFDC